MAHAFSVFVNIGGKLNPSLGAAVTQAKAQVNGLAASMAKVGQSINAPFLAAQKQLAATSKTLQKVQQKGRNLTMGVTAPTGFFAANLIRNAVARDTAGNFTEALGGVSHDERLDIERYADTISAKYGNATGILKTFNEMLKAGFDVKAAKGSIASILESSIVGDMPAEEVAGAVSKIVTQYGLGMKTVEEASASSRRISDNLAFGANATSASMRDMVEAYKFVGSAASAAGESIESTNALIIGLNKAGQTGSEAGVALRSAYVKLLKPTKGGRATMARLGLDYGDYVSGGKRTGAGVASGLSAFGFGMSGSTKALDAALARNDGNSERQRKAIYDAVVAKFGAEAAQDRDKVLAAVDGAFTMAGSKVDLTKLLIDLKKKDANQGDLANIFEGRQSVRMLALLKSDLEGILAEINQKAPGYGGRTFGLANQGLTKAERELSAAWTSFGDTLVKAVLPEITTAFSSITGWLKSLAASNPTLLKTGIYAALAAAAAGPLAFALAAVGRGAVLMSRALILALTPVKWMVVAMVDLSRGLWGAGVAALALGGRLRTIGTAMALLAVPGGARMVMAAMGASLLAFGKSLLRFPLTILRGIGGALMLIAANPVGVILTALVAALTALGVWVYNNWNGVKAFFEGFGEGFMKGLGPAGDGVRKLGDGLSSVVKWIGDLVGPLDASTAKWKEWGESVGGIAAEGVNKILGAINALIGGIKSAIEFAGNLGTAIGNALSSPRTRAGPRYSTPAPIGARALGGPVNGGMPYLVGERGPELFVPGVTGRIETNNRLRGLVSSGAEAVAGSTSTNMTRGPTSITNHWTINGADDPREVAKQIDSRFGELLRRLEADQRGLLSD
ncbi:phage tail tape measure protein [Tardiphaga robiniae]|uniref:Phage tail tape measure protein n=1 Tax=Tardiphaga robiniae TaxID=943830 RepID=A0A7G6TVI3_9BRAD|nr:phage tail tape measure protein [Tardiphaga robiniae]QND70765.1 phage tail tape measure protein [Tardiphaga robiniae]